MILDDVAALLQAESGGAGLAFTMVSVNEIVEQCVRQLQAEAYRSRVIVRTSLSQSLPKVRADSPSLRRIVLQLLGKALKSSHPGGQVIVSSGIDEAGRLYLRIRGAGAGSERLQVVSGAGQAVESREPAAPLDDGIGLPLAQALIAAHGGALVLDSDTGPGTLLEVTLPVEPAATP